MPVLILTARGEESDKVAGFRLGADDYVTKPFGLSELLARVDALLRRARGSATTPERLSFGAVEINLAAHTVTKNGAKVALTPKEFELLITLLQLVAISRPDLLRGVWGHQADVLTRTVDIHIAELRRKLEDDPTSPRHLVTVWKTGYRLDVYTERIVWSALFVLLVIALYVHARSVRREAIRDLAAHRPRPRRDTDALTVGARRAAHAYSARVVGETRTTAAYDGLVRALIAEEGYEGAWVYNATGIPVTAQAAPTSAVSPPDFPADTSAAAPPRTHLAPSGGVELDFAVPIHRGNQSIGVVIRVRPGDSTFPTSIRRARRTARRAARSSRASATAYVSSRRAVTPTCPVSRACSRSPASRRHVRAALDGRRSVGLGRALFIEQLHTPRSRRSRRVGRSCARWTPAS